MKTKLLPLLAIIFFAGIFVVIQPLIRVHKHSNESAKMEPSKRYALPPIDAYESKSKERRAWEESRLKDPVTGRIPGGIHVKELAFAKTLPTDAHGNFSRSVGLNSINWKANGPYNLGGRTRALAIDVTDDNTLLAGSVSGGLWRSTDRGVSWNRVTGPDQYFGVTCIAQDTRVGKTDTWYIGSGEGYGTSASGSGAFYLGNGLSKSTDGGLTWTPLSSTVSGTPHSFDDYWDIVWNVATNPADTLDVVYAAALGIIYKSTNGGTTWSAVRGSTSASTYSYFTDVAVTSTGVVYATLSSDGPHKGIWRSPNGSAWTNITPTGWPSGYDRIAIGLSPSNENEVFFLAVTPDAGQMTQDFYGDPEWNSLWKYTYVSGNGIDTGGVWEDRSLFIPKDTTSQFGNFNNQGGYNLMVRVKPDDGNVVFIGGTNLFRSTDGFTSMNNTTWIGGYKPATTLPYYEIYDVHHPDQHGLAFLKSDPNIMISNTDGGAFLTENNLATPIVWTDLNRGYQTTQFYTITLDRATSGSNIITGGLQDNGSWFINNTDPNAFWSNPSFGDGAHCAIAGGTTTYYYSRQKGKLMKAEMDTVTGIPTGFERIDPIAVNKDDYLFINPFILDPNNNNIMYLAAGKRIYRNDDLSQIPLTNSWDSIATNWTPFSDSLTAIGSKITCLTASVNPPNILYYGSSSSNVFRVDSANSSSPVFKNISGTTFPVGANVNCIAVDRKNADNILVVFSNYKVYSLFYSQDGGVSYEKVAGNLEQNSVGGGNGPSLRWATIMNVGNKKIYMVTSSVGVFATDTLMGLSTQWVQQGASSIGNVVSDMIDYRESDGKVVVATHGNGVFSGTVTDSSFVTNFSKIPNDLIGEISCYPNPVSTKATILFSLNEGSNTVVRIFDESGRLVKKLINKKLGSGKHEIIFDGSDLPSGLYYFQIKTQNEQRTGSFVKGR